MESNKNKTLKERYKKLKQSDRMEYLAINSTYENRQNTFILIIFLGLGMKLLVLTTMLGIMFMSWSSVEGASLSNYANELLQIPIGAFFLGIVIALFITLFITFVEIGVMHLLMGNNKECMERLNEFIDEHS